MRKILTDEVLAWVEAHCDLTTEEMAAGLGLTVQQTYSIRAKARAKGIAVGYYYNRHGCKESPKFTALKYLTERCECGLLLPCDSCLPPTSAWLATLRNGPGRVEP